MSELFVRPVVLTFDIKSVVLLGLDIVRIFGNPIKRYFDILFNALSVSSIQSTTTKVKVMGRNQWSRLLHRFHPGT